MKRVLLSLLLVPWLAWAAPTPVDPATADAAGRLIAAAKAHPLVKVLAGDDIEDAERDIQQAFAHGLTREQAKDIVSGLDTVPERERAATLLKMLGSDSDVILVLRWTLSECQRVLATEDVRPPPATGPPWQHRITRQMLFFAAPQYWWHDQTDVDGILDAVLAAGADGISVEFGGSWIADEYNGVKPSGDPIAIYRTRIKQWEKLDAGSRKRGLVAHIAFLNSNQSLANKAKDAQWQEVAREFVARYGSDNKLILPLSEDDSRTRASIGDAIYRGLLAGGMPRSQMISMGGKWGDWSETHHGRGKVPKGSYRTINVNDNGPSIADLYGGNWTSGGVPNVANIEAYVRECRQKGVSCVVYSFGRVFDVAGLAAAKRGWGVSTQPETTRWRYIGTGEKDVGWTPVDRSGAPTKSVDGSICDGLLFGCKVGEPAELKIEWVKKGANSAHTKNAWAFRKDPKYNQGWKSGDEVQLSIRDINGDERPWTVRGRVVLE